MQCRSSQHTKAKAAQAPLWRPSSRKPASRFPPGGVSARFFCWPVIRDDRTDLRNTQQGRSIWRREAIAEVIRPHLFYFNKDSMLRVADPSDHLVWRIRNSQVLGQRAGRISDSKPH